MIVRRPLGMVSRIALVLFCAVLIEFLGNVALHQLEHRVLVAREAVPGIASTLAHGQRVANASPARDRVALMRALSGSALVLNWVPNTVITDFSGSLEPLETMRRRLVRAQPELGAREMRLSLLPSDQAGRRDLVGILALTDGSFVTFRVRPFLAAPLPLGLITLLHVLLMLGVMAAALLVVRTVVRPLRDLAAEADATGRGEPGRIVPAGPHEVRRVASAFAAMQSRLIHMIEDHTQALVAVSHDLRTPLQRIRLRAALLPGSEARDAINADVSEMERFIDSTLAYVRSGEHEERRLIDVAALVGTMIDDACDLGADAVFTGPERLVMATRRTALQRMLGNLLDNARRHGVRIEVTLAASQSGAAILTVDDDGPGIAPARRAEALLPFRRLDLHRGGEGAGLGLPGALRIVEGLGGSLRLGDSPLGGLRVEVTLPATASARKEGEPRRIDPS